MAYANGRVPLDLLIHLGGNLYMFPGTYQRWVNLVSLVQRRHGVTLRITRGSQGWDDWNGYRSYPAQVIYRQKLGDMAARPGYSSHGGSYGGRESGAIDVANWATIGKNAFFQACRDVGLTPGTDSRENWHVVDYSPWAGPAGSGGGSVGDDDMTPEQDTRLRNIEALLSAGGPSLSDPNWSAAPGTVLRHLQNLTGFVWGGGTSAADPDFLGAPGTLYALAKTPVHRTAADGSPLKVSQIQELADAKSLGMANQATLEKVLAKPPVSDAQVAAITDAVVEAVKAELDGLPAAAVDYAKVADSVRAKFAAEPLK